MAENPGRAVDWVSAALFLLSGLLLGYATAGVTDGDLSISSVVVPAVVGIATLVVGLQNVRAARRRRSPP